MKRFLVTTLVTIFLLVGIVPSAQAIGYDPMTICNSAKSKDGIIAYRLNVPNMFYVLHPGYCKMLNNYTGSVRVAVYDQSYRLKGRRKCYNAPTNTSNPPNRLDIVTYVTYNRNRCKN